MLTALAPAIKMTKITADMVQYSNLTACNQCTITTQTQSTYSTHIFRQLVCDKLLQTALVSILAAKWLEKLEKANCRKQGALVRAALSRKHAALYLL